MWRMNIYIYCFFSSFPHNVGETICRRHRNRVTLYRTKKNQHDHIEFLYRPANDDGQRITRKAYRRS